MANGMGYDEGPQLPNYMKKQMDKNAAEKRPVSRTSQSARTGSAGTKSRAGSASGSTGKSAAKSRSGSASSHTTGGRTASGKPSSGRKRKKNTAGSALKVLIGIAAVLVAVILIVFLTGRGEGASQDISDFLSGKKTFAQGVKLIGVDVSGLTPEEATGLVKNAAEKTLKTVGINIIAGESSFTLASSDMGMGYDIEKTLEDGLEYGRDNTVTDVAGNGAGEFDAEYTWDRAAIMTALENIAGAVNTVATEPYAEPVTDWESSERFNYIAGEEGRALNLEDTADQVEYALRSGNFQMDITAVMNAVMPVGSIDDVKAVTVEIAEFTTKFTAARSDETKQNRKFNIQKAADIINGYIIKPGEEWSFNTVVGPRTYDLGWKGANGISGGKEYTTQAGGGICQVSTTLYNALLCGNFQITDRRAHSIPSDYVAKGLDATVDTSGIDLVWKNNTEYPVYIFARVSPVEGSSSRNTITVYIYGAPLPDGITYKARSEIIETTERTDTVYTEDATIPVGYQKETVIRHDGYVVEAYLDKYVNGDLSESTLMYTDKYKGNPAEISIGTGPALAADAVPDVTWQVYGTPATVPGA